jgi:hypothetical protein
MEKLGSISRVHSRFKKVDRTAEHFWSLVGRRFIRVHNFLQNASRVIHYCLYIVKVFLHMCDRANRPNLWMVSLGLFLLSSPDP